MILDFVEAYIFSASFGYGCNPYTYFYSAFSVFFFFDTLDASCIFRSISYPTELLGWITKSPIPFVPNNP